MRKSLLDPTIGPVLDSYRNAITAMLQLPPTDPRNWYRLAFIHALDCPHGNWWFLPWHRGFIGWFEQICRDLSGDPTLRSLTGIGPRPQACPRRSVITLC